MARAKQYFIPDQVWLLTHRCHKQQPLFRFAKDREAWLRALYAAKKQYRLDVLAYSVTGSHVQLLLTAEDHQMIPMAMQAIAGQTAQQFNERKGRRGAFWEDRYYATAVEMGAPLSRCLTYIDLQTVNGDKVVHPKQWKHGSYHEIQDPPNRYALVNREKLIGLLQLENGQQLIEQHHHWVESALHEGDEQALDLHLEFAIGSSAFREVIEKVLKEQVGSDHRGGIDNRLFWDECLS